MHQSDVMLFFLRHQMLTASTPAPNFFIPRGSSLMGQNRQPLRQIQAFVQPPCNLNPNESCIDG